MAGVRAPVEAPPAQVSNDILFIFYHSFTKNLFTRLSFNTVEIKQVKKRARVLSFVALSFSISEKRQEEFEDETSNMGFVTHLGAYVCGLGDFLFLVIHLFLVISSYFYF